MGLTILQQIEETVKAIRSVYKEAPKVGIVLGSGLGNLTSEIAVELELL